MTESRPRILFLPRWYPNRYDPMPGLFVKYQADAISTYCDVTVLYIHEDIHCPVKFEIDIASEKNVNVVRVYYRKVNSSLFLISDLLRMFRFFKAYWLGLRILSSFPWDLVHVHVLTRAGFIAYLIGKISGRPYLITEHWSRYLPENNTYKGWFRKMITRLVVRNSKGVISVSGKLTQALIEQRLNHPNHLVLPNPVAPVFFQDFPDIPREQKKQIIHVSCFEDHSKNISGFLHAIQKISQVRSDFKVLLVGEGPDFLRLSEEAKKLGMLEENLVSFCGLKENDDLAAMMRSADFLVLSSNYETFGSVVIESLACGTPVVATNVGVVPEVINETNGLIVEPGDLNGLEKAILEMLDKCHSYDRVIIRKPIIEKFSSDRIGKELFNIYQNVLSI